MIMNKITRGGLMSLVLLGGIYIYRNRASIQRFLESKGIKTPLDTSGTLVDSIRSGVARLAGKVDHEETLVSEQIHRVHRAV